MITVERTDFMKALQLVSPIVKAASDIVALKAARITANGEFVVDANDLDRSMRCRLPYQGQPAEFMLPTPAMVASAMRYAAADQVTLSKDDDAGVAIKAVFFSLKKGSRAHEWEHVCEPCTAAIRAFFDPDPLAMNVTAEDRRDARVWWATVTAYVNKDMAEYIMVRARRMIGDWTP